MFRALDQDAPADRGERVGVFADADAQPVRGAGAFARVIISVMLRGPQGFNELLASAPGLSDRLLTERLRELESEGLVRRTVIPGPPVRVSYELTEAGASLKPVIESLGRWAEQWVKV